MEAAKYGVVTGIFDGELEVHGLDPDPKQVCAHLDDVTWILADQVTRSPTDYSCDGLPVEKLTGK